MARLRILGLACVVALAVPGAALAHANLLRSDPANGAVLGSPPGEVRLFFDDRILTQPGSKAIRNSGESVLAGKPHVFQDRGLVIPLKPNLQRGDYTVLWRVLSDDGHPAAGILTFAVGAGRARPTPALTVPNQDEPLRVFERWLFLAGVLTAVGAAVFVLALRQAVDAALGLFVAAFALVVGGGLPLVLQTSLSTRFGAVVMAAVVVAVVGAVIAACAFRYPRLSRGAWLAALLLLPAPSVSGHALDPGRSRLELPVDVLHVAASSIWLGGLLALAVQLRRGVASGTEVRRFSGLALGSVLVLAATGVIRALSELTAVDHVWTTTYGRLLVAKTVLLAGLVALGWANRYRVLPALAASVPRLRRNISAELLLFVGLLTAVALLTQTRPDRGRIGILAAGTEPRESAEEAEASSVLGQTKDGLVLSGVPTAAAELKGRELWLTLQAGDEGAVGMLVRRELRTGRTTTVSEDVAPQYGLAVVAGSVVYATSALPPRLVVIRRGGGRPLVLTQGLIVPFASRGDRVAWAEQVGQQQRVIVRDMRTGKQRVVADMPACRRGRCYRVDSVTLADDGVVFARGAIGSQPSSVVRRSFSAGRPQAVELANDPQPDLIPSSAGAAYYALGRGWYRWDFEQRMPHRAPFQSLSAQPVRYEGGRWLVQVHHGCSDTIVAWLASGRRVALVSPRTARSIAGVGAGFCAKFLSLSWTAGRAISAWMLSPAGEPHAEATGVLVIGPRLE